MRTKVVVLACILLLLVSVIASAAPYKSVDQNIKLMTVSGHTLYFQNKILINEQDGKQIYRIETNVVTPVPDWPQQVVTYFDFGKRRICLTANDPKTLVFHDMNDPHRFQLPSYGMEKQTPLNIVVDRETTELYAKYNCKVVEYTLWLSDQTKLKSKVWFAAELNYLPVRIENTQASGNREVIEFSNWDLAPKGLADSMFTMPNASISRLVGQ